MRAKLNQRSDFSISSSKRVFLYQDHVSNHLFPLLYFLDMESSDTHEEMLRLLKENNELAKENAVLLKKLYRHSVIGIWIRIVWYAVLIGLPFALYFYVLEPYFHAFGADYEVFRRGMAELPGLKGLEHLLPSLMD